MTSTAAVFSTGPKLKNVWGKVNALTVLVPEGSVYLTSSFTFFAFQLREPRIEVNHYPGVSRAKEKKAPSKRFKARMTTSIIAKKKG